MKTKQVCQVITTTPKLKVKTNSVPVLVRKNVSNVFAEKVQEELNIIPEHIKYELAYYNYKIVVCRMLVEEYPELKGEKPRGWSSGTWSSASGIYFQEEREIIVAEKFINYYTRGLNNQKKPGCILRHEMGHAVDKVFGKLFTPLSETRAFKLAYNKDKEYIESLQLSKQKQLSYYLQDGNSGKEEAFAETFANLLGGGADVISNDCFSKYFSNVREFVNDKVLAANL